jgi:hypothetical protein
VSRHHGVRDDRIFFFKYGRVWEMEREGRKDRDRGWSEERGKGIWGVD